MEKFYTGIDIGNHAIKLAVSNGASIKTMLVEAIPDGMVSEGRIVSFDAMSDFLKEVFSKHRDIEKNVAFAVPTSSCITRRLHIPAMSEKELALNLPYEFRDYITQGKDKYVYDYAVLSIEMDLAGNAENFNLLAVASPKEMLDDYTEMFKRAGFRLHRALPPVAALQNLVKGSSRALANSCIIDFAHRDTQIHFFTQGIYDVSRTIDIGGADVTRAVAAQYGIDDHMASEYKLCDFEGALSAEGVQQVYESIAVEVERAMNFYGFNNPEVSIEVAYYCGGGSMLRELLSAVGSQIEIPLEGIEGIMPPCPEGTDLRAFCPIAFGATIG